MILVEPDIKVCIHEFAIANGTTLSIEGGRYVRLGLDYQKRAGGVRTLRLLQTLTEISQLLFENESDWLDNYENYLLVTTAWSEALGNRAPLPPPEKISIEDKIVAGRGLVAELLTTTDPRRRAHLRGLLETMSKVSAFPDQVRQEFAAASAFVPPARTPPSAPTPPVPSDWRATRLDDFSSGWLIAKATLLGRTGTEPDDLAIAEMIIADDDLRQHAGLAGFTTVDEVLQQRAEFLARSGRPGPAEAEAPPTDPIQQKIERGRRYVAALDPKHPRRTAGLHNLLMMMSTDPELPDAIREEFKRAAAGELPGTSPSEVVKREP